MKQQAEQMRRNPAVPEPTRREARKQQKAARGKDISQTADGAIVATAGVGAMYDAVQDTKAVGKIAQAQREAIAEAGASGNSPDARGHRPDPPPDGRVNGGEGTASPGGR